MSQRTLPLMAFPAAKLLLHLITHRGYGMFRDEFYYLACAERLAWGYVDHPPFSVFLLSMVRSLLGESLFAVRLLPALAGAATVLLVGLMARRLGGGIPQLPRRRRPDGDRLQPDGLLVRSGRRAPRHQPVRGDARTQGRGNEARRRRRAQPQHR